MVKKHEWLTLSSMRTQKYRLEDISVIIPSAAGRFEERWKWFWPQYIKNTDPKVVENTYIPCDDEEVEYLGKVTTGKLIPTEPRFIVHKTIRALEEITTRLTFRLANDIMIVRKGWEKVLLQRFNSVDKSQVIAEIQHGVTFPENQAKLAKDWKFIKREYKNKSTTAAVYPHGSRLMMQTALWRGYYTYVPRYTYHDHDEIFFSQIAKGDGVVFTNFANSNAYMAHVGFPNKDFDADRLQELDNLRANYRVLKNKPCFRTYGEDKS